MAVDADPADCQIDAAQPLDQGRQRGWLCRIGKNPLIFRHDQRRIDAGIHLALHKPAEGKPVFRVDPFVVLVQIFVHVQKPGVFQADAALVDKTREDGILSHRPDRTDEHGALVPRVFLLDHGQHIQC